MFIIYSGFIIQALLKLGVFFFKVRMKEGDGNMMEMYYSFVKFFKILKYTFKMMSFPFMPL